MPLWSREHWQTSLPLQLPCRTPPARNQCTYQATVSSDHMSSSRIRMCPAAHAAPKLTSIGDISNTSTNPRRFPVEQKLHLPSVQPSPNIRLSPKQRVDFSAFLVDFDKATAVQADSFTQVAAKMTAAQRNRGPGKANNAKQQQEAALPRLQGYEPQTGPSHLPVYPKKTFCEFFENVFGMQSRLSPKVDVKNASKMYSSPPLVQPPKSERRLLPPVKKAPRKDAQEQWPDYCSKRSKRPGPRHSLTAPSRGRLSASSRTPSK